MSLLAVTLSGWEEEILFTEKWQPRTYVHSVEDSTLMSILDQFPFFRFGLPKIGPNRYT